MKNKTSEKKPKTAKVRLSKVSSVKSTYDSTGKLVERVSETQIVVPKGSMKHFRQMLENKIIQLVEQRKLNRFVGDTLVRIIRNRKTNRRQKIMRPPKPIIPFGGAAQNPPSMVQTMKKDIELICFVFSYAEELGLDEEQKKKLKEYFMDEANKMIALHPDKALQIEQCRKFDEWRKSMMASQKK